MGVCRVRLLHHQQAGARQPHRVQARQHRRGAVPPLPQGLPHQARPADARQQTTPEPCVDFTLFIVIVALIRPLGKLLNM